MAQNTDLNVSPYYDDYNETKNFHRILFRPSNAIQARELTQLQSILQNQVEKFGNHIFQEGSLVMGGTVTVNTEYYAVKVNDANPNGSGTATAETYRTAAIDKYYQGKTSGVVGKVINSAAKTTDGDELTLFVTYVKTGNPSGTTYYSTFEANEEIEEVALDAAGAYSNSSNSDNEFKTISASATFTGSAAIVRSGIFYTRGFFVRCDEQTILLDKYANTPTYRIGLQITESLATYSDDASLLDNATGSSNENAPGANRLKIELTFVKKAVGGTQDIDNFIELSRVEAGIITKQIAITAYNTLAKTLARRTYDESGDYIISPFNLELREHLNTQQNNGIYLSSNTTTPGDKTKFVGIVSPGKGYVKGFEVDKPSQNLVTISKARTTEDAGALAVPFEIGNYYNINSVLGQPEFGTSDSAVTPFGIVDLHADAKANLADATASGTLIGKARCRYFNYTSGNPASGVHIAADLFKLYLFDIRMYTLLTVQATMANYKLTAGQRIVGATSGAKATVAVTVTSGVALYVMDVEGTFQAAEYIRAEWDASTGITANRLHATQSSAVRSYSTDRVRSLFQASRTAASAAFTADTVLTDNQFVLSGNVNSLATGDATVTGVNTKFTQEIKEGDVLIPPSGTSVGVVASITTDTSLELAANAVSAESGKFIRQRAQLQEQEKTVAISSTPKDFVSSMTPNSVVVRKQATSQLNGSGVGSITALGDEVLLAEDANDYMVTIMESAEGSDADEGDVVDISETGVGGGQPFAMAGGSGGAITITGDDSTPMGDSDQLKIVYAVTKDVANNNAAKTIRRSRGVKVITQATATSGDYNGGSGPPTSSASTVVYGTNFDDEIISLGVPDVYAIRAIYESNDTTEALPPKLTLASGMGTCNPGDQLVGSVTGAIGHVIQKTSNDIYFFYTTKELFTTADTVTNKHNTDTATNSRVCTAIVVDSKDISGNFLLDDGQRDGYYGLGSIKRKAGTPKPQAKILIVFDYFTSGGGSFYTVNSYGGAAEGESLSFESIPHYVPNIIDPQGLESDGKFELSDAVDFRSYVHSLHDPSAALDPTSATNVSSITAQPLAYATEEFTSARAVTFDLPKSETSLSTTAMVHYLPRIDKIALSSDGQFVVATGQAADEPAGPTTPSNSILLHTLFIPPYTTNLGQVSVSSEDHRRYTMKDIGRIQGRVRNLERVTSLNALEQQTNLTSIQDADGLDRFKSGFVTDTFRGHRTGDVFHPDYKIGVDRTTGTLRPMHHDRFVELSINTSSSSGYTKTGDLITLPFTETPYVTIDKASTTEFINPYDVVIFNGTVTLSPSKDLWFDTQRLPSIRRTTEGDYDTVVQGVENALGTIWNNWQTDWVGEPVINRTTNVPWNAAATTAHNFVAQEHWGQTGEREAPLSAGPGAVSWWAPLPQ